MFERHLPFDDRVEEGRAHEIYEMCLPSDITQIATFEEARQLRALLRMHCTAERSDPRDRVYGLLSLMDVPHGFDVDYAQSTLQLASRTLLYFDGPFNLRDLCDALDIRLNDVLYSL